MTDMMETCSLWLLFLRSRDGGHAGRNLNVLVAVNGMRHVLEGMRMRHVLECMRMRHVLVAELVLRMNGKRYYSGGGDDMRERCALFAEGGGSDVLCTVGARGYALCTTMSAGGCRWFPLTVGSARGDTLCADPYAGGRSLCAGAVGGDALCDRGHALCAVICWRMCSRCWTLLYTRGTCGVRPWRRALCVELLETMRYVLDVLEIVL